ncbi:MAG: exonuclease SbcCD subunit D C-terminal domain-containing protein [Deltaproteobacteria bacterium]|nr:exonuclease SbcCD subunit D C-terminal domain-containing protein [Deltaproteobacteria bacterium]
MRILHTADWHLGQHLFGISRQLEHQAFLDWLLDVLVREAVDALIIAGDIFDVSSPSPAAQKQYYRFLAQCRATIPDLGIFVVGGNHDSPLRLDAPKEILDGLGIHVVGGLPHAPDGSVDLDRAIFPIWPRASAASTPPEAQNEATPAGWLIAVPFLRPRDQLRRATAVAPTDSSPPVDLVTPRLGLGSRPPSDPHEDLVEQHRALYRALVDRAEERRVAGQPLVATGHLYMANTVLSELSERKIQVGNQYALPVDIFPDALAYVALGHLHRAQTVADQARIRYSGAPIPLSMAERHYEHQVLIVDTDREHLKAVRPLRTPRSRDLLSVPDEHAPLESVLEALRALPRPSSSDDPAASTPAAQPLLEVRVQLDHAHPRLRRDIEAALEGADVRLVRIDVRRPARNADSSLPEGRDLAVLSAVDVFRAAHQRARGAPVPPDLMASFLALLSEVEAEMTANASAEAPTKHVADEVNTP